MVLDGGVAAAALQQLLGRRFSGQILPLGLKMVQVEVLAVRNVHLADFSVRTEVEASEQISLVADGRERCALAGSRLPTVNGDLDDRDIKSLSFLHPLDEGLQAARKFLNELVPRDVVGGLGNEQ